MSEVTSDAMILISCSWQALNRLHSGKKITQITETIVVKLFASIYIEACLNFIIEQMKIKDEMEKFFGSEKNPNTKLGLRNKISFFYNKFEASPKAINKAELKNSKFEIDKKLEERFNGFNEIIEYRNKIAHGNIYVSDESLENVEFFRNQSKSIGEELIKISKINGYDIEKNISYLQAIGLNEISEWQADDYQNFDNYPSS